MNRRETVQALAACDALAAELRKKLRAEAEVEYRDQGCAPTWRMPGFTVTSSVTHNGVAVDDQAAFVAYVAEAYPTEVETVTVTRVRPAWQERFLKDVVGRGEPPCDADGRVIPGLRFVPGGEFKSVSVTPAPATKDELRFTARQIASGALPLALPVLDDAA